MAPATVPDPVVAETVTALLRSLPELQLERFIVAGSYVRFDDATRNSLKDFRQKLTAAIQGRRREPSNFLLWGAPGSGKTFLVHEVAAGAGEGTTFRELNLAQLGERELRDGL